MARLPYYADADANTFLDAEVARTDPDGKQVLIQRITPGSDFKKLLKFEPDAGEELRAEESSTDRYHGAAPDGSLTTDAVWKIVRFYKDAAGDIIRVRYREGVAWDSKTTGWT